MLGHEHSFPFKKSQVQPRGSVRCTTCDVDLFAITSDESSRRPKEALVHDEMEGLSMLRLTEDAPDTERFFEKGSVEDVSSRRVGHTEKFRVSHGGDDRQPLEQTLVVVCHLDMLQCCVTGRSVRIEVRRQVGTNGHSSRARFLWKADWHGTPGTPDDACWSVVLSQSPLDRGPETMLNESEADHHVGLGS